MEPGFKSETVESDDSDDSDDDVADGCPPVCSGGNRVAMSGTLIWLDGGWGGRSTGWGMTPRSSPLPANWKVVGSASDVVPSPTVLLLASGGSGSGSNGGGRCRDVL